MRGILKGLLFLMGASLIILVSDLSSRKGKEKEEAVSIAVFNLASRPVLTETQRGFMDYVRSHGFDEEQGYHYDFYNPEGDMPTAHTIATLILNKKYDYVFTVSTPALQTMASANSDGEVIHMFAAVTDPFTAGVGIMGPEPDQHPAWLVGFGSFQPVERALELLEEINPKAKRIGTVWCSSEVCSEACVLKARKYCTENDLELVEMVIDNSNMVVEATNAMIMKNIDAIWIGADNVVELAIDQLIDAAKKAGVPLFANTPNHANKGALFGVGADYYDVGQEAGKMMEKIFNGEDPASFRIENVVPEDLVVNPHVASWAGEEWTIPKDLLERAKSIVK